MVRSVRSRSGVAAGMAVEAVPVIAAVEATEEEEPEEERAEKEEAFPSKTSACEPVKVVGRKRSPLEMLRAQGALRKKERENKSKPVATPPPKKATMAMEDYIKTPKTGSV